MSESGNVRLVATWSWACGRALLLQLYDSRMTLCILRLFSCQQSGEVDVGEVSAKWTTTAHCCLSSMATGLRDQVRLLQGERLFLGWWDQVVDL